MNQLTDAILTNQTFGAVVLAIAAALAGLWLAAAWWTYADLARRVEPELARFLGPAWILASTPVLLPLSLPIYLLARPQATVAERRSREILAVLASTDADVSACPECGLRVDPQWRRCPTCTAWLGAPCSHCGRWSNVELELCPFCATDWTLDPIDVASAARPAAGWPGGATNAAGVTAAFTVARDSDAGTESAIDSRDEAASEEPHRGDRSWVPVQRPVRSTGGRNPRARDDRRARRAGSAPDPQVARIGR